MFSLFHQIPVLYDVNAATQTPKGSQTLSCRSDMREFSLPKIIYYFFQFLKTHECSVAYTLNPQ